MGIGTGIAGGCYRYVLNGYAICQLDHACVDHPSAFLVWQKLFCQCGKAGKIWQGKYGHACCIKYWYCLYLQHFQYCLPPLPLQQRATSPCVF